MSKKVKVKRDDLFSLKIEYENVPILRTKVRGSRRAKKVFSDVMEKFDGK